MPMPEIIPAAFTENRFNASPPIALRSARPTLDLIIAPRTIAPLLRSTILPTGRRSE
jgi:hypothetical protein